MAEISPGLALRQLKQAHARLKKARQLLTAARDQPRSVEGAIAAAWESLTEAHRIMANIPRSAVDDAVLNQQLSVQRYASTLLVRVRRLLRREPIDDLIAESDTDLEESF
jgi:hypothetical protein